MKKIALVSGPLLAILIPLLIEIPAYPFADAMMGIAVWMAIWWLTECVPLAVTALIPLVAFPLSGIASARETGPHYMTSIMFLFMGGFLIAQAMERTGLHKRVALLILSRLHASPVQLLIGFGCTTAMLSMWISNTATTMLMVTIAIPVLSRLTEKLDQELISKFAPALLLMIAYSANIGGMGTPVGTVPNLVFLEIIQNNSIGDGVTFLQWMSVGVPVVIAGLVILFLMFSYRLRNMPWTRSLAAGLDAERDGLGVMGKDEQFVAWVLGLTALAWMTRKGIQGDGFSVPGWSELLPYSGIDDGTVAIAAALLLFLIPIKQGRSVLDQNAFSRLPWGVLILLGGGFALAMGMQNSGLSEWIGGKLEFFSLVPVPFMLLGIALVVTFLTEITSNTATTQVMLPILAAVAIASGHDVIMTLMVATLAASCAFMLPVATPPNAIIFGTNHIHLQDMVRQGIKLNLIMPFVIIGLIYLCRPLLS